MRSKVLRSQAKQTPLKSVKEMFKPSKHTKPPGLKSPKASSTPEPSGSPVPPSPKHDRSIIKRNLFGIRLNHDQLNRDLAQMWKEQMEKQKQQWNFDFERLRPVNMSRASKSLNDLSLSDPQRYDWIRVNTYFAPSAFQSLSLPDHLLDTSLSPDFVISAFDKREIDHVYKNRSSLCDDETETEEEEDEALAVPQFYKYQRRLKLITNLNQDCSEDKENKKCKDAKVKKPLAKSTRRRRTRLNEGKKLTQSLIITFSENRRDTLRSAQNISAVNKKDKKDNLKQQSLLDLFKERKRKTSGGSQ
ncbi:hypothetical protein BpHYR1_048207 [Brachionus plicatilis]|uniref:Cyclin-dependent kinase inhibitor domain-containing protein n=1 Tax=Brachionus plicatilis TaxID=10195 RepID=A0A3M7QJC1_BRAPC|nr:hypothetical protein BpHYR1_048207 [Brachionus plicatilis]